jgi:DNA-binding response OmpR family regulator
VLIVEDDADTRDIVAVILEDEDVELLKAAEVPSLADIAEAEPDLILLDEWLPGKNGSEFCLELKSKEHTAHIPVILISAVCDLETIAQKCRADGFINKPFDIEQLKQVVNDYLIVV